jgi:hypothetical protein
MIAITITAEAYEALLLGTAEAPSPKAKRVWLDCKFVDRLGPDARRRRDLQRGDSVAGKRVPFLNAYRTMCIAPSPDFLPALEGISALRI